MTIIAALILTNLEVCNYKSRGVLHNTVDIFVEHVNKKGLHYISLYVGLDYIRNSDYFLGNFLAPFSNKKLTFFSTARAVIVAPA